MGIFNGKIAVVTGSTSGIGKAIATMFSNEGAEVIIIGRNNERGTELQNALKKMDYIICENLDDLYDNFYLENANKLISFDKSKT